MPTANQSAHSGTVMMEIKSTAKLRERWAHWPVLKAEEIVADLTVSSMNARYVYREGNRLTVP